ncbi:MAG: hypothetical protein IPL63_17340 [Saprospiraceae bacterium]|nr:hypothetical protein [Saprospiraceae bacterium]MBK6566330.1 hypothetical protein [Saprospiraceae bacterium]MBK6783338.1 hypothetical protein [Saprospiraceae bacterium]MBK7524254.1 hypothetical protein [Saprospiraceae bacterium]MBK8081117.1 hypothetical protein [Saprospiraceae bacterium]
MEGVFVVICLCLMILGISYLYYSTRHKERLSLIEKGVDASIFFTPKSASTIPVWKILNLNLALVAIGVGLGIITGGVLAELTVIGDAAYPACIFLISGVGLLYGYFQIKELDK